jgi:hypothetical protein
MLSNDYHVFMLPKFIRTEWADGWRGKMESMPEGGTLKAKGYVQGAWA